MTLEEYQDMEIDKLFFRLGNSKFRSRFHLTDKDKKYVLEKGMDVISSHAYDFISKRLAPEVIPNDGKQTPWRGHPVFVAQHATGCCCRGCLEKWHGIKKGHKLSDKEVNYVLSVIMEYIRREYEKYEGLY